MNDLDGMTALVTSASQGLGRALGLALGRAGARVVLVARRAEPLAAAAEEIRAAGGEAHAIAADVADREATFKIAGQAAALVGPIDLLVNNASTLGPVPLRLLLDTDCEDLERALAVNLVGPFRLTKAIAGPMVLRGHGTIVNVTSDAATEAYERWGAYGASKAALEQLGRIWAAELAGTGVRVLTVDPGEMDTRMHADAIPDADRGLLVDPARVAERILALVRADETPETRPGARIAVARIAIGAAPPPTTEAT
jgi:NAD(P)-dependent dehydrogenase (short-subunit alcohol dehydrogenase family)